VTSKILRGCTVRRVCDFAREMTEELRKSYHKDFEVITNKPLFKDDLFEIGIEEMFFTSGDLGVDAVGHWDDIQIGDGKPGPVYCQLFQKIIDEAIGCNSKYHRKIEY